MEDEEVRGARHDWSDGGGRRLSVRGDSSFGPGQTGQSVLGRFVGRNEPVTVLNRTPYPVRPLSRENSLLAYPNVGYLLDYPHVGYKGGCVEDQFDDPGIKAGYQWTSSTGSSCLVNKIVAVLELPAGRGVLTCTN